MRKLNKKGFTLVELLAVIVVLAIIIVIVAPNIMNSVTDAKTNGFVTEAKRLINTAKTQYQADLLKGMSSTKEVCYNIEDLDKAASSTYLGFIVVKPSSNSYLITIGSQDYYAKEKDETISVSNLVSASDSDFKNFFGTSPDSTKDCKGNDYTVSIEGAKALEKSASTKPTETPTEG